MVLKLKVANYKTKCISGEFHKYTFSIRAYKNTGKSLIDVNLISSEAELMMILKDENIKLENISSKENLSFTKNGI